LDIKIMSGVVNGELKWGAFGRRLMRKWGIYGNVKREVGAEGTRRGEFEG
jgi:hypothetical protein